MVLITGKSYDYLKFVALVLLPALGTLYFALAGIWDLPAAEKVVNTIIALDTFLGVVLHLSSRAYDKSGRGVDGQMDIQTVGDKKVFQLTFDNEEAVHQLPDKKVIRFRVNHEV